MKENSGSTGLRKCSISIFQFKTTKSRLRVLWAGGDIEIYVPIGKILFWNLFFMTGTLLAA